MAAVLTIVKPIQGFPPRTSFTGAAGPPHHMRIRRKGMLKQVNPMTMSFCAIRAEGQAEGTDMDFDKYTERARGFVQSAQTLALREGHQQFTPEHLLKVLLDDPEGLAAGLIDRSGGNSREALSGVEAAL